MEKKIAVYVCAGCGIGDAIDIEQLSKIATEGRKQGPHLQDSSEPLQPGRAEADSR